MQKIRSIAEAYKEIKQIDSKSSITKYAIRALVNNGTISHICRGRKILIDFNELQDYLNFRKLPVKVTSNKPLTDKEIEIKPYKSRF